MQLSPPGTPVIATTCPLLTASSGSPDGSPSPDIGTSLPSWPWEKQCIHSAASSALGSYDVQVLIPGKEGASDEGKRSFRSTPGMPRLPGSAGRAKPGRARQYSPAGMSSGCLLTACPDALSAHPAVHSWILSCLSEQCFDHGYHAHMRTKKVNKVLSVRVQFLFR